MIDLVEAKQLESLEVEFYYTAEMDEFWSFVGSKKNQRWTWYALDKQSGLILAWHNGKRTDEAFKKLLGYLLDIPIKWYYTDSWGSYAKLLPEHKHRVGKDFTWRVERRNLNFRTHIKRLNRKTICFSKDETIHDNVIGMYIEEYYYKTGLYGNIANQRN